MEVRVFTNAGEVIISPPQIDNNNSIGLNQGFNQQFQNGAGGGNRGGGQIGANVFPLQFPVFLVKQNGFAKLPLIGEIFLENLTLDQADSLLEIKFEEFYEQPFVRTRYSNKKVVVFKGTQGLLFPLRNEKVNLVDVLAQTGGMGNDLRATNIRLIRGDLRNPNVYVINLKTIDGLRAYDLTLEPNDIIYVEPVRKPFLESLRDISPVLTFISTIATLGTTLFLVFR